jgi:hypothetical protein
MRIVLCSFGNTESASCGRTSFCDCPVAEVKVLVIPDIVLCEVPGDGKYGFRCSRQSVIILIYLILEVPFAVLL